MPVVVVIEDANRTIKRSDHGLGGVDHVVERSVPLDVRRDRDLDYIEDILHPVAGVIEETLSALEATPQTTDYHPSSIQDYAGELDDTKVLLVMIRFEVLTSVDPDF